MVLDVRLAEDVLGDVLVVILVLLVVGDVPVMPVTVALVSVGVVLVEFAVGVGSIVSVVMVDGTGEIFVIVMGAMVELGVTVPGVPVRFLCV